MWISKRRLERLERIEERLDKVESDSTVRMLGEVTLTYVPANQAIRMMMDALHLKFVPGQKVDAKLEVDHE